MTSITNDTLLLAISRWIAKRIVTSQYFLRSSMSHRPIGGRRIDEQEVVREKVLKG